MRSPLLILASVFILANGLLVNVVVGDIVVNVDARSNLPPDVSGSAGEAMQFLNEGYYTFTLVNNVDGHAGFHPLADYTAWSFHTPGSNWGTNYNFAWDDNDSGNDTLGSPPFVGPDRGSGGNFTQSANALDAFDATMAERLSIQVHIPFDQTIGFYISDNVLSDNAGGVSILIRQSSVPEPSALCGLFGAGAAMFIQRRRRSS